MAALVRGLSPLVSLGFAYEHAAIDGGPGTSYYVTEAVGMEVAAANVLAIRVGKYRDRLGDIDGTTFGWSVALPLGDWAGARIERATFPQSEASGLGDLTRKAYSVWLNPLAIWRSARGD